MSILPVSDDLSVSLQSFVGRFLWQKLDEGLSRVSSYVISDDGDPILHDVQPWKTQKQILNLENMNVSDELKY